MPQLNDTHDPARRSWVSAANDPETDFPIQNLAFGIFRHGKSKPRGGVAIGDQVFDIAAGQSAGLFSGTAAEAARAMSGSRLNELMRLGNDHASALRARLSELLRTDGHDSSRAQELCGRLLVPMHEVSMQLPASSGAFTDFFTSIFHAERGGRVRNPDQPLTPNFKHIPIGYNGRASSIRVSGEMFKRPNGQFREAGELRFGPEPRLDYELEVGAFIARGNALGSTIPLTSVRDYIFGYCLLNDWSARAIQAWETVPAGPFQGKSFFTTISPWVVTAEALAPFSCTAFPRAEVDPKPLPYLSSIENETEGGIDLDLYAYLLTANMRANATPPAMLTATNLKALYWTFGQMATHHASNGSNFVAGDLIGSGTVSGPRDESRACMNELSAFGTRDIVLGNGERRRYLHDGDEVIFRARARREGYVAIGFGECRGCVEPAISRADA
jgi:fumarylacetoacetase